MRYFDALFRQQLLISAVGFRGGANVARDCPARERPIGIGAGTFVVVQHAIGEFDVEGGPGRTPLVGRSGDLVDHLVQRVIRGYQEVGCICNSKPRLAKDEVRGDREQRAFARLAQVPNP